MGSGTSIINHPLCVHTVSLHHQTHVPPWSVSHWWVNLGVIALFPRTPCNTDKHTHRNMHDHEANSCLPRLCMQMKMCDYGIQCKPPSPPPPFPLWQICITCITCSTCWLGKESEASWARLSSRSKQPMMLHISRAFRHQCPGLKTSFSFCTACLCILLLWRCKRIQFNLSKGTEQPWNKVIDFSSV